MSARTVRGNGVQRISEFDLTLGDHVNLRTDPQGTTLTAI